MQDPPKLWPRIAAALALAALTIGVYARGVDNWFVSLDDPRYVTENHHIAGGLSWSSVRWAFTTTYAANWHPLTWLSHILDVELFGLDAGGHHLTSAVLHGLNALVLLAALFLLTRAYWTSFFVAALFALHPLRVESVAWVSERKDLLAALFLFAALAVYARYARRPNLRDYLLVALAMCLSLMAKPMAVTLPFVLLLLDFWPLRRLAGSRPSRLVYEKLPLFALAGISSIVTIAVQRSGGAVRSIEQLSWGPRIANAFDAYTSYLGKLVWPAGLSCFYPHQGYLSPGTYSITSLSPLLSLVFLMVASATLVSLRKRAPAMLVGWLWFLGTLVPVIGIVQVGQQAYADRYTYVPMIGLLLLLAFGLKPLALGSRAGRILVPGLGLLAIAACVPLTWRQIGVWKNDSTLYEHALEVDENDYNSMTNYAVALTESNDPIAAEHYLRRALEIVPANSAALIDLGNIQASRGQSDEAKELYEQALELNPNAVEAHNNLAALAIGTDYSTALVHLERALSIDPDHADANRNLARLHIANGNWAAALPYARKAFELRPRDPDAAYELGLTLYSAGGAAEAAEVFETVLELRPFDPGATVALAKIAVEQGRVPDAIAVLKKTLEHDPDWADGYFELARIQIDLQNWQPAIHWLQQGLDKDADRAVWADQLARILSGCPSASLRDYPQAIRWAQAAVDLTHEEDHNYLTTLAVAHALSGNFDEAIRWQTKALELAPVLEKKDMRDRLDTMVAERKKAGGG